MSTKQNLRGDLVLSDDSDKYFIRLLNDRRFSFNLSPTVDFRLKKSKIVELDENFFILQSDGLKIEISKQFDQLYSVLKARLEEAQHGKNGKTPSVAGSTKTASSTTSTIYGINSSSSTKYKMNPLSVEKKSGDVYANKPNIPRPEVRNASPMKLPYTTASTGKPTTATIASPVKSSPSAYHTTYSGSPVIGRGRAGSGEFMSNLDGKFREATPEKVNLRRDSPGKPTVGIASNRLFDHKSPVKIQPYIRTYGTKTSTLSFLPKHVADSSKSNVDMFDAIFGAQPTTTTTLNAPSTPPKKYSRVDEVGGRRDSVSAMLAENTKDRFHAADSVLASSSMEGKSEREKPTFAHSSTNVFSYLTAKKPHLPPPPKFENDENADENGSPSKTVLPPMPAKGMAPLGSFYNSTRPTSSSKMSNNVSHGAGNFIARPLSNAFTSTSTTSLLTKPSVLKGGIRNLGNACYMSSILQALFSLDPTMQHFNATFWSSLVTFQSMQQSSSSSSGGAKVEVDLLESEHKDDKPSGTTNDEVHPAVKTLLGEFQALSKNQKLLRGKYNTPTESAPSFKLFDDDTILDLRAFKKLMGSINNIFSGFGQQDAHEFLTSLLTHLEEEMKQRTNALLSQPLHDNNGNSSTPSEGKDSKAFFSPASVSIMPNSATKALSTSNAEGLDREQLQHMTEALKAVIPPVYDFESVMSMQLQCQRCQFTHPVRHERYRDFSLDLPETLTMVEDDRSAAPVAMSALIKAFVSHETRELKCPHCAAGNEVCIRKEITTLPPVLILHIKRFTYSMESHAMTKSAQAVAFPTVLELHHCGLVSTGDVHEKDKVCKVTPGFQSQYQALYRKPASMFTNKTNVLDYVQSMQSLYFDMQQCIESNPAEPPQLAAGASDSDYCYKLSAVVRHLGATLESGHYVSDVYDEHFRHKETAAKGSWLRCNDSMVMPIDEETVLRDMTTPYIFFYQLVKK